MTSNNKNKPIALQDQSVPQLQTRGPIYVLPGDDMTIKPFPRIEPPEHPSLCVSCQVLSRLSIEDSSSSSDGVIDDAGRQTFFNAVAGSKLNVEYALPAKSWIGCPMCRLLACDRIWDSGSSPFLRVESAPLKLQLELQRTSSSMHVIFAAQGNLKKDRATIELFAKHGTKIAENIWGRPWNGIAAQETFETILEHLKWCKDVHSPCKYRLNGATELSNQPLPTRVIDVGTTTEPTLRLVESAGHNAPYVALSHCWGAVLEAKTTRAVYDSYLHAIDENSLSPMLKDVVQITRRLKQRYIWVDSFCIIQDDWADWAEEARNMGAVYENAEFTIAATDGHDGNYRPLDESLDQTLKDDYVVPVPLSSSAEDTDSIYLRPRKLPPINLTRVDHAPLNRRAWVTQERVLSRRILHYTAGMVFLECDALFDAMNGVEQRTYRNASPRVELLTVNLEGPISNETYANGSVSNGPLLYNKSSMPFWNMTKRLNFIWSTIVHDYNTCGLTRQSDKLPAIEGLGQSIAARTGLKYHCGLFFVPQEMIPAQLAWMASEGQGLRYKSLAPSWSWAAYDGAVEIWDMESDVFEGSSWFPRLKGEYPTTIEELRPGMPFATENELSDPERFGSIILTAHLKLTSRTTTPLALMENPQADGETLQVPLYGWPRPFDCPARAYGIHNMPRDRARPGEANPLKGWVCFDETGEDYEPGVFCILPLIKTWKLADKLRTKNGETTICIAWRFVAVQRVMNPDSKSGLRYMTFQRVGYGEAFGEDLFRDSITTRLLFV